MIEKIFEAALGLVEPLFEVLLAAWDRRKQRKNKKNKPGGKP